jgi:hypothetical protein
MLTSWHGTGFEPTAITREPAPLLGREKRRGEVRRVVGGERVAPPDADVLSPRRTLE